MKLIITLHSKLILLLFLSVVMYSCQKETDIPFPEKASGFEIPKTIPFQMPEGKPINWKIYHEDSSRVDSREGQGRTYIIQFNIPEVL